MGGSRLGGLHEDKLGVLLRDDGEVALVGGGDPVTDGDANPVHFDEASGRSDVRVAEVAQRGWLNGGEG